MTGQFNESDASTTSVVSGASSNLTIQPLRFQDGGLDAFEFALQYFQPIKSNKLMMAGICGAVVEFTCFHITANTLIPVFINARLDGIAMLGCVEFLLQF